jgi:hypothetical protein
MASRRRARSSPGCWGRSPSTCTSASAPARSPATTPPPRPAPSMGATPLSTARPGVRGAAGVAGQSTGPEGAMQRTWRSDGVRSAESGAAVGGNVAEPGAAAAAAAAAAAPARAANVAAAAAAAPAPAPANVAAAAAAAAALSARRRRCWAADLALGTARRGGSRCRSIEPMMARRRRRRRRRRLSSSGST